MPLAHLDPVTDREPRPANAGTGVNDGRSEHRAAQRKPATRPCLQLRPAHQPMLNSQRGRRGEPVLVVARGQVVTRLHSLHRVPELPFARLDCAPHNIEERPGHRLPLMAPNRFRRRMTNRPEPLPATQVMDTVHPQDSTVRAAAPNVPICILAHRLPPGQLLDAGGSGRRGPGKSVALCDRRRTPMHPRPYGRVEKIFAPYIETGTLATGELADHQPHIDDDIAQAQLKTGGLKSDPPTADTAQAAAVMGRLVDYRAGHQPANPENATPWTISPGDADCAAVRGPHLPKP
jgi:hypothetical protein